MRRHGPRAGGLSPWRTAPACRARTRRHRRTPGRTGAVMSLGRTTTTARPVRETTPNRATRIRWESSWRSPRTATQTARPVIEGRVPCCVAPRSRERTSPRAVRAGSRLPTTWPCEQESRRAAGHRCPPAREGPRRRNLPRANRRARTQFRTPGHQRQGGSHAGLGIPTARLGLLLVSMRHPAPGGTSMARDSDLGGPARAAASRGAESLPPCRTRANAQLLAPLRGSGLRGRPPQLRDGRGLRAGAMLPAFAPAARHRGRHHARARRAVPRRRVPCIAMRCQRAEGVGSDSADSAADMPGALSQHDFVSDYTDARAARGRS